MSELRNALKKWYIALPFYAAFAFLYLFCALCAGCVCKALFPSLPLPASVGSFLLLFALPPGALLFSTAVASATGRAVRRRLHGLSSALLTSYLYLLLCIFLGGAACLFTVLCGLLPLSRETLLFFAKIAGGCFLSIHLLGYLNAQFPRVRHFSCLLCGKGGGKNAFLPKKRGKAASASTSSPPALRVTLLSDLHFGYFTDLRFFHRVFQRVRRESPDLLLIAGDFFDYAYDDLAKEKREALKSSFLELGRSLPYGIYFCEGNHDVVACAGDGRPGEFLAACGIRTLADEAVTLTVSRSPLKKLTLVGRKDLARGEEGESESSSGRKSPAALLGPLPKDAPLLLLDHRPKQIPELAKEGADLILCGHVHNGQSFPGNLLHRILSRYAYGKAVTGDPPCLSYTTSGCGRWAIPLRLFTSDEIAVFDLFLP